MTDSASADLLSILAKIAETPTEQHPAMASALGIPNTSSLTDWQIAHTTTFLDECPPHASMMVSEKGNIGGEAAARVTDFRRLLGGAIPERHDNDNLAGLLSDYAALVAQARTDERAHHARTALLQEHLLSWITPYLDSVQRCAMAPYHHWAELLRDVLYLEAKTISATNIIVLPLHLRSAPPIVDLDTIDKADGAIQQLLTPVRSGLTLTRTDLERAAQSLGLTLMRGQRSTMLKYLMEQEGPAMLRWLARVAQEQADARQAEQEYIGNIATFWSQRANQTAKALSRMIAQDSPVTN